MFKGRAGDGFRIVGDDLRQAIREGDYNLSFILNLTSRAVNPTISRDQIIDPAITTRGMPDCL